MNKLMILNLMFMTRRESNRSTRTKMGFKVIILYQNYQGIPHKVYFKNFNSNLAIKLTQKIKIKNLMQK